MIGNVAIVMRGTLLAQIIGLLILPVMSRSFSPEAFGHFQVFQSLLGLALVIATFRYEIAIMRAETPRELGALLAICAGINLFAALLICAISLAAEIWVGRSFAEMFGFSVPFFATAFVIGGTLQYLGYFLAREKLFAASSNSKVVQALANAGTALALALARPVSIGIVLADVVGRAVGLLAMLGLSRRRLATATTRPQWADIAAAIKRYRDYPLVTVPSGLINMAGATLTSLMIYHYFDAATSGQFGLLERSATLPIGLIVVSVSQVYMSHLANDVRSGRANAIRRFNRLVVVLAMLALPVALVLIFLAPWLFAIVFGAGWEQAALFAQLMAPAYCLALIAGSINMTLLVVGRQKLQLVWEGARLIAMAALWAAGAYWQWGVETMVAGHSAVLTAFSLIMIGLASWAIRAAATARSDQIDLSAARELS